jgi:hypothetical protein
MLKKMIKRENFKIYIAEEYNIEKGLKIGIYVFRVLNM